MRALAPISIDWPARSMRLATKPALALVRRSAPLASVTASGLIRISLPAPSTRAPLSAARGLPSTGSAAPWARRITEPFSVTLVVALMRPIWLTAMPTRVVLPRAVAIWPPMALVALPSPARPRPARPTSTSRPRTVLTLSLLSAAYSADSSLGSLR